MRQLPADKYNVAWFKLAEFVARGEKERALGLYRLLSHSFDDHALAYQLEGDLLLSFNDQEALEKYAQAALLYEKQERLMEAIALYEHIIAVMPLAKYLVETLRLYETLSHRERAFEILELLCTAYLDEKNYEALAELLNTKEHLYAACNLVRLYEKISLSCAYDHDVARDKVLLYAKKVIDRLLESHDESVQTYLANFKAIDEDCYQELCAYIEDKK